MCGGVTDVARLRRTLRGGAILECGSEPVAAGSLPTFSLGEGCWRDVLRVWFAWFPHAFRRVARWLASEGLARMI
jgi:hypothetical protein